MFHRLDKRTFIRVVFAFVFLVLATGVVVSIQPAKAQAPYVVPSSAPPLKAMGAKAQVPYSASKSAQAPQAPQAPKAPAANSVKPISAANVPVLQGHLSPVSRSTGGATVRSVTVPDNSLDMGRMG